jgi:hypothetical protein
MSAQEVIIRRLSGFDTNRENLAEDFASDVLEGLTEAGYRILAPGEIDRGERILQNLDPENALDDSLLHDIHRRLQKHGEKYPDRAVSVLHRNVVLYTIQAAIRSLSDKEQGR